MGHPGGAVESSGTPVLPTLSGVRAGVQSGAVGLGECRAAQPTCSSPFSLSGNTKTSSVMVPERGVLGGCSIPPPVLMAYGLTVSRGVPPVSRQPCTKRSGMIQMYVSLKGETAVRISHV